MFDIIILLAMLLFVLVLLFVIFSAFLGFLITKVPFVPTSENDIKFIVEKLGITSKNIFYDLGSGNGKVCFLVHELCGARCVGFELTWWTHLWAEIRLKINSPLPLFGQRGGAEGGGVQFYCQNFLKANWSEANFIYGYLYPFLMVKVEEKFIKDCKPGTVAVTRDFPFPNLKPTEVYYLPKKHEIYVYKQNLEAMKCAGLYAQN